MANEFIARKGLIVLANGARVTGSLGVQGDINATGYNITASNLSLLGSASIDGDVSIGGNITVGNADIDVVKFLAEVSSSIVPDVNNSFDLGSASKYWRNLYVSGTAYINSVEATSINLNSITVLNDLTVEGNTTLGNATTDVIKITGSLQTSGSVTSVGNSTISGSFTVAPAGATELQVTSTGVLIGNAQTDVHRITGSVNITGSVTATSFSGSFSGSGLNITNIPNSGLQNSSITVTAGSGLSGGGTVALGGTTTVSVNSGSMLAYYSSSIFNRISGDILINTASGVATIQPNSVALGTDTTGDYVSNITAGNGISTTGASTGETISHTISLNTSSAHFLDGVKQKLNTDGVVSSSIQIDVRNTTGIATIATTGSNTFTGVQTISNTTNSTNFTNGALIVQGGVGIAKDVNISGSLNVTGLFTAVSMSTQYVTSSQVLVADNEIILNATNATRYGGISVVDSGSTTPLTGSLYWDSFYNRWIVQNVEDMAITSGILILGPENVGTTGNEDVLVEGRVPVATEGNHIDNRLASSSIRIDFPSRLTHIEAGLYVTGAVTSSVGFSGDGSQLTGIVTNLNITGSDGGTGTVALKTQALTVDGTNGLTATVSGQTITISGSNATTTTKGVASFNATNFTVTGGEVTSNNISLNGTNVTLGGTRNVTLQEITQFGGSTTSNQVTLSGGAIIHGVLYTSGSNTDVDIGTEVVATVATGSYDAAFFDYVVKKGVNYRAGTVMAVWDGANNVEFTDTSTNDLGSTADVVFTVDALTSNIRLKATVSSNDWFIKTAVRAI